MDTDEPLRRRREQYRARATKTPQQSDEWRARREYNGARRATLSCEERRAINDTRRIRRPATTIPPLVN